MFSFKLNKGFSYSLFTTLLLPFIFSMNQALASFTDKECLDSQFKIQIKHKAGPLGIFEKGLTMEKTACIIKIVETKWKFSSNDWLIDVCRGPIHIKKDLKRVEVIKKDGPCHKDQYLNGPFCVETKRIKSIIQDDGLIFANGEKENL